MNSSDRVAIRGTIVAVLYDADGRVISTHLTRNIVTNAGDLYYAERGVAQAVPSNFVDGGGAWDGIIEIYNGASAAPAKGNDRSDMAGLVLGKAMSSTYPKINDSDVANTGAGADIITYLAEYSGAEANAVGIADVIITNPTPGASEALLMHAEFGTPFTKLAGQTLKVFVNHSLTGV
jgi:hypothetical protein